MKTAGEFETAGRRVAVRLAARRAWELANRTVAWTTGAAVLAVVSLGQLLPAANPWPVALAILLAWVAVCTVMAWVRRPDTYSALAHWDKVSRTPGSLASAGWFAMHRNGSVGEVLHLREAGEILQRRLLDLGTEVPSGRPGRKWWILAVVPVLLLSGLGRRPIAWEDRGLTPEMRLTAAALADGLEATREEMRAGEKPVMEDPALAGQLEDVLADAGNLLADPGQATTGEILDALESRANAVESLAKQFQGLADWVPGAVLEELERHADTAPLAGEIRERRPVGSAEEADRLADVLAGDAAASRIEHALDAAARLANPEEAGQPVLRSLVGALDFLQRREPGLAGNEFRELGAYFRGLAQKQAARDKLESLARQLRSSGEQLAGRAMDAARETGSTPSPPDGADSLAAQAPPPGDNSSQPSGEGNSGAPGSTPSASPPPPGGALPGQQAAAPAPVPGTAGPPPGSPSASQVPGAAPVPGAALPGGSSMALSAPVPGQPGPGTPGGASGGVPGLNAGEGTAEMRPDPTKAMASNRDDLVVATAGADGESEMRTVESDKARSESATRSTRETSSGFAPVEESAMNEQSLPAGRREQVRRYFSALREQFEAEGGGTSP